MALLLTRPAGKKKTTHSIATDAHVAVQPTAVTLEQFTVPERRRGSFVADVAGFISEIQQLLDEVRLSDGARGDAEKLLRRAETDPADPLTWGEVGLLRQVLHSETYYSREREAQGLQPLEGCDRTAACISLRLAEMRGDEDAIGVLQEALAVGQTAVARAESSQRA